MPTVERAPAADRDLRNIAFQIGIESGRPRTAEAIVRGLVACCERLAELSPIAQLGTAAPRLGTNVRLFSFKRWVVVFRYSDKGVLVLRIADGSQDYLAWRLDE